MQSLFSRLSQIAILDPLDQLPKIIRKICAGFSWMLHGDVEAIPHRLGGDRGSAACFLDFASVIFVIEYVRTSSRNIEIRDLMVKAIPASPGTSGN